MRGRRWILASIKREGGEGVEGGERGGQGKLEALEIKAYRNCIKYKISNVNCRLKYVHVSIFNLSVSICIKLFVCILSYSIVRKKNVKKPYSCEY